MTCLVNIWVVELARGCFFEKKGKKSTVIQTQTCCQLTSCKYLKPPMDVKLRKLSKSQNGLPVISLLFFFPEEIGGKQGGKKIKERQLHFNSALSPPSSSTDPVWRRLCSFYSA